MKDDKNEIVEPKNEINSTNHNTSILKIILVSIISSLITNYLINICVR